MFTTVLFILALLLVAFLVVIALQPAAYRIERSLAMSALPADLFPHMNDLRKAAVWSPWLKMDPAALVAYEGPAAGVGAGSTWSGNRQLGEGRQTIVESRAHELVRIKLEFRQPFAGVCMADFSLKPDGARTLVIWSLNGEGVFIVKALNLLGIHGRIVGLQFDRGLADLKALVEHPANT